MNHSIRSATAKVVLSRRKVGAMLAASTFAPMSFGQSERRVRFIVPTSTGASIDAVARIIQPGMAKALGIPVFVENIPGASSVVGLQTVARSAPNEMTIAIVTNTLVILPNTMKAYPFDVEQDFTPLGMLVSIPLGLAVNSKVPAASANEFIALLKRRPDALNFSSPARGSIGHLATEMFLDAVGGKATHIPYQGSGPAMSAIISGQVDFGTQGLSALIPHATSGSVRTLGIFSPSRSPAAPDVPTMEEQGVRDATVVAWATLVGPKGMDPALVAQLYAAAVSALESPAIKEKVTQQGNVIDLHNPSEARAIIGRDLKRFAALSKKIKLTAE